LFTLMACSDGEVTGTQTGHAKADAAVEAQAPQAVEDARVVDAIERTDASAVDASVLVDASHATPRDASAQQASWLIAPGDKVFFIGNSFFEAGGRVLPEWLEALGNTVQPKFPIETGAFLVPGNQPLAWFFEQDDSKNAIASGDYDMFILQGEDREPVDHKEDFQQAVRDYYQAITAKGGKVMLFMTWDWASSGGPDSDFFEQLSASYDEIGKELNVPVIPVGIIYNDANKDPFPGEQPYFTTGGDLHQTASGSAINTYATFSMLTGIDAMGIVFDAPYNDNTPEMLKYCSDKSWARVMERLK
jgi:hypothetical protein